MENNYLGVNIASSENLVKEIKTQTQKAEWLAVWMILSGETNIWGRKQNQKYTRQPYARLWRMH